jgi:hypothetical protein
MSEQLLIDDFGLGAQIGVIPHRIRHPAETVCPVLGKLQAEHFSVGGLIITVK